MREKLVVRGETALDGIVVERRGRLISVTPTASASGPENDNPDFSFA
jgi:hypothetical protein